MTDGEKPPCHTCAYHKGWFEHCGCDIALESFHHLRCTMQGVKYCIFYRAKTEDGK